MTDFRPKDFIHYEDLPEPEVNAFNKIIRNIYERRGIDFRQYRPKCLRRRIVVGMHGAKVNSFTEFSRFLDENPDYYDNLLDKITINVSEFFRNPETFAVVKKDIIPEIISAKKSMSRPVIRIWSAGCAIGEEPYSLAIILKELLDKLPGPVKASIYATDIDPEALKKAGQGMYKEKALRELSHEQIRKYFTRDDNDFYHINAEVKSMVKFLRHNMISDPPLKKIDLIFCRNVIIYFSKETIN